MSFTSAGNSQGHDAKQTIVAQQVALTLYVLDEGLRLTDFGSSRHRIWRSFNGGINWLKRVRCYQRETRDLEAYVLKKGFEPISSIYDVTTTRAVATYLQ